MNLDLTKTVFLFIEIRILTLKVCQIRTSAVYNLETLENLLYSLSTEWFACFLN